MRGKLAPGARVPGLSDATIGDFWSWAYSDLRDNTVRGAFAEWVVGTLLGAEGGGRVGWDAVDLRYRGRGLEVKSAAYVQAWRQDRLSRIEFQVGRRRGWDAASNEYASEASRSADAYVFCLYPERDVRVADPIDVVAWQFWVVPTRTLDTEIDGQKSLGLRRLQGLTTRVAAQDLRASVDAALDRT